TGPARCRRGQFRPAEMAGDCEQIRKEGQCAQRTVRQRGMAMKKLSLTMKLGAGFGILLLILVIMGVVAFNAVGELTAISDRVVKMMAKKDMASQIEA